MDWDVGKERAMFTTRLISGIILVLLSVVVVGQGGVLLFGVTALISAIGLFELYRVLGIERKSLAAVGYATACSYYGILWFEGQKYFGEFPGHRDFVFEEKENCILKDALRWLDIYFSRQKPDFLPKLHLIGTDFQREVWDILLEIPYGQTVTYGEIARKIADKRGLKTMSAQAVGGAVGHNRVSVIVPCHRVIGSDGSLTGYAGGIERKIRLLDIEQPDFIRTIPEF